MSSSEPIIRRSRPGRTAGGTNQIPISVVTTSVDGSGRRGDGSVIRGRRFGLGSGGAQAHDGFGGTRTHGRLGASGALAGNGQDGAGVLRSASAAPSLTTLQVDLHALRQRAEDRGYAVGQARAQAELAAAIEACGLMAGRIEAMAPRETTAVAHALVALSTAIARRIVGAELHLDPTLLVAALESAITAINGSPEALVLLHPDQLATVQATWEAIHGTAYLGKRWTFEADPSLQPGGCVLRYEHGFVAAGLEAQVDLIAVALEEAIPGLHHPRAADAGLVEP